MSGLLRTLCLCSLLPAATFASGSLTFGGGLNFSSTDTEEEGGVEYSPRVGYNLGVGYEIPLAPNVRLVPELNIETRGERVEGYDPEFDINVEATLKMLYLQVPVYMMVAFPLKTGTFTVFGGPSIGVNLESEMKVSIDGQTFTGDVKDDTAPMDIGIQFGAGYEHPLANGSLFVRPSYYLGFGEPLRDSETKLRNFQVKVGYRTTLAGRTTGP